MSRRITVKTQISNRDLAVQALSKLGAAYQVSENTITITSGPIPRGVLDLTTGILTTDSDYGNAKKYNLFQQAYSEVQIMAECLKEGTVIEQRIVDGNKIRLMWYNGSN